MEYEDFVNMQIARWYKAIFGWQRFFILDYWRCKPWRYRGGAR